MWGTRFGAGVGICVDEALGEGLYEGGFFGPGLDECKGGFRGGGTLRVFGIERGGEGAAVEAGAGAGVLRSEAEGEDAGDAVGAHLADYIRDEWVPVAHGCVDRERMACGGEGGFEQAGLGEGPAGEGWGIEGGDVAKTNLGVTVLEFGDNRGREGAATGDFGEVLCHLAERVGGAMGEQEDGGRVGLGLVHAH
jgi:hypothetical protein